MNIEMSIFPHIYIYTHTQFINVPIKTNYMIGNLKGFLQGYHLCQLIVLRFQCSILSQNNLGSDMSHPCIRNTFSSFQIKILI